MSSTTSSSASMSPHKDRLGPKVLSLVAGKPVTSKTKFSGVRVLADSEAEAVTQEKERVTDDPRIVVVEDHGMRWSSFLLITANYIANFRLHNNDQTPFYEIFGDYKWRVTARIPEAFCHWRHMQNPICPKGFIPKDFHFLENMLLGMKSKSSPLFSSTSGSEYFAVKYFERDEFYEPHLIPLFKKILEKVNRQKKETL